MTDQPQTVAPAPGWYADPQVPGQQRYWDGRAWTANIAPLGAGQSSPIGAPAQKKGMSTGAMVGLVVGIGALVFVVLPILAAVAIPVFLSQQGKAVDSAAKADVSTLGKEIATYWVDGSVPPTITDGDGVVTIAEPGGFAFDVPLSEGVELGSYWIDTNTSWCISVVAADGEVGQFRYSAQYGLEPGTC